VVRSSANGRPCAAGGCRVSRILWRDEPYSDVPTVTARATRQATSRFLADRGPRNECVLEEIVPGRRSQRGYAPGVVAAKGIPARNSAYSVRRTSPGAEGGHAPRLGRTMARRKTVPCQDARVSGRDEPPHAGGSRACEQGVYGARRDPIRPRSRRLAAIVENDAVRSSSAPDWLGPVGS